MRDHADGPAMKAIIAVPMVDDVRRCGGWPRTGGGIDKSDRGLHLAGAWGASQQGSILMPDNAEPLALIGDTPMIELTSLDFGPCRVFAKLESQNPTGSIKDRIAMSMIDAAERSGALKPGGADHRGDRRQYRAGAGAGCGPARLSSDACHTGQDEPREDRSCCARWAPRWC